MIELSSGAASNWKRRGEVPFSAIKSVTDLTGCLIDWIVTGKGEMRPGEATGKADFTEELQTMRTVVEAVEEHLQAEGKQLPPAQKAELITTLYDMFSEDENKQVDKKNVAKLIKLAS